ncbi:unnamed protein product [Oreochromis niloticus]|nr:unnamed protein product [Mustela putorius furo]
MNTSIPAPASAPLLLPVLMSVASVCVLVLLVLLVLLVRRCVHSKPEDQEESGKDDIITHVMYNITSSTANQTKQSKVDPDNKVKLSVNKLKTLVMDKQGGPDFKPEPDVVYSSLK